MIRIVVFDFDGTLVRSNHIKAEGFVYVARLVGGDAALAASVLEELPGADRFKICRRMVERMSYGNSEDRKRTWGMELARAYTIYCRDKILKSDEVDGASAMLERLKGRGISLNLNSATPEVELREIVSGRGWTGYFEGIYGNPRSKLDILSELVDKAGGPENVLMVGDSDDDLAAAEACGTAFVGIELDGSTRFTCRPAWTVSNLHALIV